MPDNQPLVSIVVPTYNCAAFLPSSIGSILAQTYDSYEIIVINDGSTDNTSEVLQPFMQKIRYIQLEQNRGGAAARNIGIRSARGKYIAFFDADDLWLPEKLQTDIGYFNRYPDVSMVCSRHINMDEHGKVFDEAPGKQLPSGNVFSQLFSEQNFVITSSVTVRKEVFEAVGVFDEELVNCQDWDLWLRIAFHFKVAGINKPLVKYRHNPHSLSKNRNSVLKYQKVVIEKAYHAFKGGEHGISEALYKKRLASHYAKVGRYYLRTGDTRRARENFALSLKYSLLNVRSLRYYLCTFFRKSK